MNRPISWPNRIARSPAPPDVLIDIKGRLAALGEFKQTLLELPLTGDCCVYSGSLVNGYPVISISGKQDYLHLYWWRLFHQRIPRGRLRNLCGRQGCVSPLHWVEAPSENFVVSEALRTPIGSDSENPHNMPILSESQNSENQQICQPSTGIQQNQQQQLINGNLLPDTTDMNGFKNAPGILEDADSMHQFGFSLAEMRMELDSIFACEAMPTTWQDLRLLVPEWQCPDDMLIKLIEYEPRIAHLRPSIGS